MNLSKPNKTLFSLVINNTTALKSCTVHRHICIKTFNIKLNKVNLQVSECSLCVIEIHSLPIFQKSICLRIPETQVVPSHVEPSVQSEIESGHTSKPDDKQSRQMTNANNSGTMCIPPFILLCLTYF